MIDLGCSGPRSALRARACVALAVALAALLAIAPASAQRTRNGFFGVALGMSKDAVMALGMTVVDVDEAGFAGQQFYQFETGNPGQSFHVTFRGAKPEVVYMELDWADRSAPSALPPVQPDEASPLEFGRSNLSDVDARQPREGRFHLCRPFDIIEGTYLMTTTYAEEDDVIHVYVTEAAPEFVISGAIDPAFGVIAQSVLVGVAITRPDYVAEFWCPETAPERERGDLPQVLIDRLEWPAILAELPEGDPRLTWVADRSRWRFDPDYGLIGKQGNVVYGDMMTLELNAECSEADIALFLAMPATEPIPYTKGDILSAEFGILAESGFYADTESMEVIGTIPYEPGVDKMPLSILLVTPGTVSVEWLKRLQRLRDVWGYQIQHAPNSTFQASTNAWDLQGLNDALSEALRACRRG